MQGEKEPAPAPAVEAEFHKYYLKEAIAQALKGEGEGGIPIGSVLVRRKKGVEKDTWHIQDYEIIGKKHYHTQHSQPQQP